MQVEVELFVRKLNNTELNNQNTNDAYVRLSKEIREAIPHSFFDDLNSEKIKVINRKTHDIVDNWVRCQYYPSNGEYRVVNLSSVYSSYEASPGDYLYIEKVKVGADMYYEIYMKTYRKVCLKYSKSNKSFEILNEQEVSGLNILDTDLILFYRGEQIKSKIYYSHSGKKRADSPSESRYYIIENLSSSFFKEIRRDSFVEIVNRAGINYLEILDSWSYSKFVK